MAKVFPTADTKQQTWQTCNFCSLQTFKTSSQFLSHLRERHCIREGGSFICRYGYKGVCASLPVDGVSDQDYEAHVIKYHMNDIKREQPEEWSVYMAAQNLPAVLNDPSRGKQSNIFTKKWGDSFVEKVHISPTHLLPEITYDHLDSYIKQIGKRYRRHIRLNQNIQSREFDSQFLSKQTQSQSQSQRSSTSPLSVVTDINDNNGINSNRQSSSHDNRKITYELTDTNLEDIPQIFIKPNLDFTSIETFEAVFPGICDDSQKSGRLLQEKLSHYLDIVEVLIAKQVSEKSSAFFHAMTSQDTIMENMNDATTNVIKLREKMKLIDEKLVKNVSNIVTLDRRRTHYCLIYDKLKLMATVHQTQPMIQLLLGTQDYVAALDLISTTQEIVAQELIGIHCFKHLPSQLTEMERLIDKMLATDFEKYSTMDLSRRISNDENLSEDDQRVYDEDKLICIVAGLLRQKNFSFIDTYKDEAIVAIRALLKQLVIEVISTSDDERCLTGAGEVAQCLTIAEWVSLLKRATGLLLSLLRRIKRVLDVMQRVSEASAGKRAINGVPDEAFDSETFLSDIDHKKVEDKLKDVMHSICSYCHERCANLISSQSLEKHVASADEIQMLWHIVNEFCLGCEELSSTQRIPLTAALQAQATKLANKFHAERKSKLSLLLDNERWKQVEVPVEYQQMINRIANGDFSWNKSDIDIQKKSPASVLFVETEPFALVNSALILVQIISEYCQCATSLPMIAQQLSRHLIDLLRTFNSKCCQLVLGAGALRVAGLTTITTSNLALVSRALKLVIWFIPRIKDHFQKIEFKQIAPTTDGTPANGSVSNNFISASYGTIEKDFISHIKEIDSKVLTIVTPLIQNQLNSWDARPPVPSQSFRNISRHFVKLHEALAPILPEQQIHQLYRVVHKNFKDKLRELLMKYNIVNNGGPQHGMVTSELTFYMETLRTLKAMPADELKDDTLDDIWEN